MKFTRRSFLGTAAATGVGAAGAGCLGGSDAPNPPVNGDPDADVTVTVYEDFACPHCLQFKLGVYPVLEEQFLNSGEIRYEFRDYPVPVDRTWSWAVGSAAREVYETEGNDAFWSFASEIYKYQMSYNFETIATVADEVGADGESVREAAEEDRHRSTLEDNKSHGQGNGVQGTPSVLVDGELVEFVGEGSYQQVALQRTVQAIEDALE
ncbi:DsbA family protein [Halopiger goleimassiliensis]|uniref:DsbA family protein n=1 Tax=Halopiger goleimassiliensis TaxID=1293048 RepID=UPI000677CA82|nr:thioredoxin domain-containing protein [Halopiger goleimassiliensis]